MSLIFDSGPLVALYDRGDINHQRARRLLRESTEVRVIPVPTLAEVDYWLSTRIGPDAFLQFLRDDPVRVGLLLVLREAIHGAAQTKAGGANTNSRFTVGLAAEVDGDARVATQRRF